MNLQKKLFLAFIALYFVIVIVFFSYNFKYKELELLGFSFVISIIGFTLISNIVRAIRYYFALKSLGIEIPFFKVLAYYYIGIGFTLTPGKVGELIKIKYLNKYHQDGILYASLFVVERCIDLLILFSFLFIGFWHEGLAIYCGCFVGVIVSFFGFCFIFSKYLKKIARFLINRSYVKLSKLFLIALIITKKLKLILNLKTILIMIGFGIIAWSVISFGIARELSLLANTSILEFFNFFAISVLSGAALMSPSGVGTTELISSVILSKYFTLEYAVAIGILIRVATFWVQIVIGLVVFLGRRFIAK